MLLCLSSFEYCLGTKNKNYTQSNKGVRSFQKNFNQALKDKINNSHFPGEQEFYFGSGMANNVISNKDCINKPNIIIKSSTNSRTLDFPNVIQERTSKGQDDFFDWDYNSIYKP